MALARSVGVAAAALSAIAALGGPASAYTAAGDRLFPATLVLPQIAPTDEIYLNYATLPFPGGAAGNPTRNSGLTIAYSKTLTDRLGVVVDETYTRIDRARAGTAWGWQNFDGELKFLAVDDIAHEFLLTLGVDRETGGTGAARVGASPSGATTPRVYFGKGLGDLDIGFLRPLAITGLGGIQIGDTAARPDIATAGFVVQYSLPYLQSKVANLDLPDLIRDITPMTEVQFTAPAGRSYGARATALIAPGFSYAGPGYEIGVEALIPATRATGTGIGVTAQIHFSLDYLFPDTIGKPLFSTP